MPKMHVVFVGDGHVVRFEAAIGVHPDIRRDLKLCRASFVDRQMLLAVCRLHPDIIFLQINGSDT